MKKTRYLLKTFKKQVFHIIYLIIVYFVDLSELIYKQLNYFKNNYKVVFSGLFEEKEDQSTKYTSLIDSPSNPYIKIILGWLSGLFGEIPLETSSRQSSNLIFFSESISPKNNTAVKKYVVFVVINLLFLLYFYFT